MITLPHRAPLVRAIARLRRAMRIPGRDPGSRNLDFLSLAPDQVQELRYGLGRHRGGELR